LINGSRETEFQNYIVVTARKMSLVEFYWNLAWIGINNAKLPVDKAHCRMWVFDVACGYFKLILKFKKYLNH
jgi:hypothetical protein